MDILFIEGLELPCRVGCTAVERQTPQSLRVDVEMYCSTLQQAGQNDDLSGIFNGSSAARAQNSGHRL